MKKILIIEDEISYSHILREEVTLAGDMALMAADGIEGLHAALQQHPDLILLDLRLPRMGGMTMLEELRKDEWGKTAKVIIITNLEFNGERLKEILATSPLFCAAKSDITLKGLLEKIKEVLA